MYAGSKSVDIQIVSEDLSEIGFGVKIFWNVPGVATFYMRAELE